METIRVPLKDVVVALCHFCEQHGPNVIFHTRLVKKSSELTTKNKSSDCIACNPLGLDPGFTSTFDDGNQMTYSSGNKCSEGSDNRLQQACFRSLSSEVNPMKEGPIFFSDSGIGIHVISYTFFLKDSSARGFQRWFSLICLASESAPLLKLWTSMVLEMKEIVCYLQLMSAKVYQSEEELCSQKMLRSNFKNSSSSGFSRSLYEITGNSSILSILHSKMSHLLLWMSCANKPVTKHLENSNTENENLSMLIRVCKMLGSVNFRRFARHILKGGLTCISTDDLFFKEKCINALQLLMPVQNVDSFVLVQHTLKSVSEPYLLISPKASTITCIWNDCETYTKASCIVSRLEKILFSEDVSLSFISKQLHNIHGQLMISASKLQLLEDVNRDKVLQFFQSFGYDIGDMDILQHWSTFC